MSTEIAYVSKYTLILSSPSANAEFCFSIAGGDLRISIEEEPEFSSTRIFIPKDKIEELVKFLKREVES